MKILITLLLLFSPFTIEAATCTKKQVSNYEKLADQIQTTFDYVENNNEFYFNVTFHNVHNELYLINSVDFEKLITYQNDKDGILMASKLEQGKTYTFQVLNKDTKCSTKVIDKITVVVPNYNAYYKDPLCQGIEEFEWCQKWVNVSGVSYESFKASALNYKQQKENSNINTENPDETTNIFEKIRNFIGQYYLYIVGVLVVIATIVVIIISKRKDKKFKF